MCLLLVSVLFAGLPCFLRPAASMLGTSLFLPPMPTGVAVPPVLRARPADNRFSAYRSILPTCSASSVFSLSYSWGAASMILNTTLYLQGGRTAPATPGAGGYTFSSGPLTSTLLSLDLSQPFDLSSPPFTEVHGANLPSTAFHSLTPLSTNQALILGGQPAADGPQEAAPDSAYTLLFGTGGHDVTSHQIQGSNQPARLAMGSGASLSPGALYVGGARADGSNVRSDTSWLYHPPSFHSVPPPPRGAGLVGANLVPLSSRSAVLFAGQTADGTMADMSIVHHLRYTPRDGWSWRSVQAPGSAPPGRFLAAAASLPGDRSFLNGGKGADGTAMRDTWVLNLSPNSPPTWTEFTSAAGPSARFAHTAVSVGPNILLGLGWEDNKAANPEQWHLFQLGPAGPGSGEGGNGTGSGTTNGTGIGNGSWGAGGQGTTDGSPETITISGTRSSPSISTSAGGGIPGSSGSAGSSGSGTSGTQSGSNSGSGSGAGAGSGSPPGWQPQGGGYHPDPPWVHGGGGGCPGGGPGTNSSPGLGPTPTRGPPSSVSPSVSASRHSHKPHQHSSAGSAPEPGSDSSSDQAPGQLSRQDKMHPGVIAAAVIGSVMGLALLLGAGAAAYRSRAKKHRQQRAWDLGAYSFVAAEKPPSGSTAGGGLGPVSGAAAAFTPPGRAMSGYAPLKDEPYEQEALHTASSNRPLPPVPDGRYDPPAMAEALADHPDNIFSDRAAVFTASVTDSEAGVAGATGATADGAATDSSVIVKGRQMLERIRSRRPPAEVVSRIRGRWRQSPGHYGVGVGARRRSDMLDDEDVDEDVGEEHETFYSHTIQSHGDFDTPWSADSHEANDAGDVLSCDSHRTLAGYAPLSSSAHHSSPHQMPASPPPLVLGFAPVGTEDDDAQLRRRDSFLRSGGWWHRLTGPPGSAGTEGSMPLSSSPSQSAPPSPEKDEFSVLGKKSPMGAAGPVRSRRTHYARTRRWKHAPSARAPIRDPRLPPTSHVMIPLRLDPIGEAASRQSSRNPSILFPEASQEDQDVTRNDVWVDEEEPAVPRQPTPSSHPPSRAGSRLLPPRRRTSTTESARTNATASSSALERMAEGMDVVYYRPSPSSCSTRSQRTAGTRPSSYSRSSRSSRRSRRMRGGGQGSTWGPPRGRQHDLESMDDEWTNADDPFSDWATVQDQDDPYSDAVYRYNLGDLEDVPEEHEAVHTHSQDLYPPAARLPARTSLPQDKPRLRHVLPTNGRLDTSTWEQPWLRPVSPKLTSDPQLYRTRMLGTSRRSKQDHGSPQQQDGEDSKSLSGSQASSITPSVTKRARHNPEMTRLNSLNPFVLPAEPRVPSGLSIKERISAFEHLSVPDPLGSQTGSTRSKEYGHRRPPKHSHHSTARGATLVTRPRLYVANPDRQASSESSE